jgi:hypothetical protein
MGIIVDRLKQSDMPMVYNEGFMQAVTEIGQYIIERVDHMIIDSQDGE